jgi:hypothetical protein
MNWKCMFGLHKWSKWKLMVMTRVYVSDPDKKIEFHKQMKMCDVCELRKYKDI